MAPYLFITPFFLSFIIFFLFPAGYSLYLSFCSYRGYGAIKFVGFENYVSLLTYSTFWQTVSNTLFYFVAHFAPVMIISFLLAVLMHSKILGPAGKILKPLIFMPQIVAMVSAALTWRIILATHNGVVNQILGTQIPFLTEAPITRWCVVLLMMWRQIGWFMVIYLAGLTTINDEISDAAKIDGATGWQSLIYVTIPMMKPIFMFAFMTDCINSFKIFTQPNVLVAPNVTMPTDMAPVMNILLSNIKGGSFGMASASGWLLFIMILIVSALQLGLFKRKEA
jgi:ABC-type sugar transport system permease subunit